MLCVCVRARKCVVVCVRECVWEGLMGGPVTSPARIDAHIVFSPALCILKKSVAENLRGETKNKS